MRMVIVCRWTQRIFWEWWKCSKIGLWLIVEQPYKNHWIVHLKWVDFMLINLYLTETIEKKKRKWIGILVFPKQLNETAPDKLQNQNFVSLSESWSDKEKSSPKCEERQTLSPRRDGTLGLFCLWQSTERRHSCFPTRI